MNRLGRQLHVYFRWAAPTRRHPVWLDRADLPVRALRRWLEAAEITRGAVFRAVDRHDNVSRVRLSDRSIARLVKEHAKLIGLDPERYAGHSLRAGLATSAADGGASDRAIMRQTGHRSTAMVNRYVREGRLFRDNAALLAGL